MRILLDALPVLPRGGGLQNIRNLWRELARDGAGHEWLAVARVEQELGTLRRGPWQELKEVEGLSLPRRMWLEHAILPRLARDWGAEVIFTPMGAGPLTDGFATVVGWHGSPIVYPESPLWTRMDWRTRRAEAFRHAYARRVVRAADVVCVQTSTMARRLSHTWDIPGERIHVVPNGPSSFLAGETPALLRAPGPPWKVLAIGEPKPPKNLVVVPLVARELARLGASDVEVVLTLREGAGKYMGPMNEALRSLGGGDVPVRRIGRVPHEELGDLYRSSHAVFMPSLAESFSATYVEAMQFGVPLVTSDLDFARDICGEAALYADPMDPPALACALLRVLRDDDLRARLREEGFRRVRAFPGWEERVRLYVRACEVAAERRGSGAG